MTSPWLILHLFRRTSAQHSVALKKLEEEKQKVWGERDRIETRDNFSSFVFFFSWKRRRKRFKLSSTNELPLAKYSKQMFFLLWKYLYFLFFSVSFPSAGRLIESCCGGTRIITAETNRTTLCGNEKHSSCFSSLSLSCYLEFFIPSSFPFR